MYVDLKQSVLEEFIEAATQGIEAMPLGCRTYQRSTSEYAGLRGAAVLQAVATARRQAVVDQHGTRYESITAAARALGVAVVAIRRVLDGRRQHVHGFRFRLLS